MWTVQNSTSSSINVTDIPGNSVEILPYKTASFEYRDFESSRILSENLANGSLCITNFGSFAQGGPWLPVTYPAHPMASETQDGHSQPLTVGVFSVGKILLNVTSLDTTANSSIQIGWEEYDGTDYYPTQSEITTVSATGQTSAAFNDYGIAGRLTWTIVGTVEFSLLFQLRN